MANLRTSEANIIDAKLSGQAEIVKNEQEKRKAEQLTPEKRNELMGRSEKIRRLLSDTEQRENERIAEASTDVSSEALALDQKVHVMTGADFSIRNKIQEENQQLATFKETAAGRREFDLRRELAAIQSELQEDDQPETSKELPPDVMRESSAKTEQTGAEEKPQAESNGEVGAEHAEAVARTREKVLDLGSLVENALSREGENAESVRLALRRLEDNIPQGTGMRETFEEMTEKSRSLFNHIDGLVEAYQQLRTLADQPEVSVATLQEKLANMEEALQDLSREAANQYAESEEIGFRMRRWAEDHEDQIGYDVADEIRSGMRSFAEGADAISGSIKRLRSSVEDLVTDVRYQQKET